MGEQETRTRKQCQCRLTLEIMAQSKGNTLKNKIKHVIRGLNIVMEEEEEFKLQEQRLLLGASLMRT